MIKQMFWDLITKKYDNYYDIIEVPMHLSFIKKRLDNHYYSTKQSVVADVELIQENCYKYSEDDSKLTETAFLLCDTFRSLVESIE